LVVLSSVVFTPRQGATKWGILPGNHFYKEQAEVLELKNALAGSAKVRQSCMQILQEAAVQKKLLNF
jgi:hypothetical protein